MFNNRDISALQLLNPWFSDKAVELTEDAILENKRLVVFPSPKRKDLIIWKADFNEQVSIEGALEDFSALKDEFTKVMMSSPMATSLRSVMSLEQMRTFQFYGALATVIAEAERQYRSPRKNFTMKYMTARLIRPASIHAILNNEMKTLGLHTNVALVNIDSGGVATGACTLDWRVQVHEGGCRTREIGA